MNRPGKEMLQHRCTASLNNFESALNNLGVVLDPKIGNIVPRLMQIKGLSG
jgi:hypothetical protein